MMSLRKAVNAKCRECIYDPGNAGSALMQITLCHCTDCPLWPVRPTTTATPSENTLKTYGFETVPYGGRKGRYRDSTKKGLPTHG